MVIRALTGFNDSYDKYGRHYSPLGKVTALGDVNPPVLEYEESKVNYNTILTIAAIGIAAYLIFK